MARLLLVSNRLPVTVQRDAAGVRVIPSAGGLATGLSGPHRRSGGLWVGWPGDTTALSSEEREQLGRQLAQLRTAPVELTRAQVQGFYEGFSNRVLWPLFHYLVDHLPLGSMEWEVYREVNQKFADEVVRRYQQGDLIWVHDYQLCLVPGMLRAKLPGARIGFFLHIPFPSSEVLQALPWRNALLEGLLGADLVGFHTFSYGRHFSNALVRLLGLSAENDRVRVNGRVVRFGAFPMGIDAKGFDAEASSAQTDAEVLRLKEGGNGQKLLLGVDRLDYTKGIRRRLLGFARFLEREPQWREKVRLLQIAVPSRTEIEEYEEFRQDVDEVVGRINGSLGTTRWMPIHYLNQAFSRSALVSCYRSADAMLVTPLRDGMNLVAKEFVASRRDERGVLLLSELAGAAAELGEALPVNPYDVDGIADAISRALTMTPHEQGVRMRALRARVFSNDVHHWVATFLEQLTLGPPSASLEGQARTPERVLEGLRRRLLSAPARLLLLDCDGTLLPFHRVPALVQPTPALMTLLLRLSSLPATRVELVSGRSREVLDEWFAGAGLTLHAEHGQWTREPGGAWVSRGEVSGHWKERVRPLLEAHARRTPGSFVEEKSSSLGFHYRMADPEQGALQANELLMLLREGFTNAPVEILAGDHVVEVRPHGVSKGSIVSPARARTGPGALVLAMGDDRTDEDLFQALPEQAIALHVGPRPSVAPFRLEGPAEALVFLTALADEASSALESAPAQSPT